MKLSKPKMKTAQISLRVNSEILDRLQALATKNGIPVSEVVRQIIADAV